MRSAEPASESWKKMVLRGMRPPAWLADDAPHNDIVISTRCRFARNVRGYPFPHHCSHEQLSSITKLLLRAIEGTSLEVLRSPTEAERDYLLGCRLLSPHFRHRDHARAVLLDPSRTLSAMIHEEDHLRLQTVTAGWSLETADLAAETWLRTLSQSLQFAYAPNWGYLTASPSNVGEGRRRSALFHLIGLAHTGRLAAVLAAVTARGLTVRGVFGESSRAVGWFFQVSSTTLAQADFRGACEYLIEQERLARSTVPFQEVAENARLSAEFAVGSIEIALGDALRVLAWLRWSASANREALNYGPRQIDSWMAQMEVHGTQDPRTAARRRAVFLRERIEGR